MDLRAELEARLRKERQPFIDHFFTRAEPTEGERLRLIEQLTSKGIDQQAAEKVQRRVLAARDFVVTPEQVDELISKEANNLLPFVEAARERSGYDGPLTDDEFTKASMAFNLAHIGEMLNKIRMAADAQTGSKRGVFLSFFAKNVEEDLAALEMLQQDPTDEKLGSVVEGITRRFSQLGEQIASPEDPDP